MTPKEKANDLIVQYQINSTLLYSQAKQCALIAIDEILNYDNQFIQTEEQFNYWKEIKQELEQL